MPDGLNTIRETQERLKVSKPTVYDLMRSGRLRSVKVGSRRLISDSAIEDFISELEHDQPKSWAESMRSPRVIGR